MSYDVSINRVESIHESNYTYNVSEMFTKAFRGTKGLWIIEDETPYNARIFLLEAIENMENNKEEYVKLNPENGWGIYEGALKFLRNIFRDLDKLEDDENIEISIS